MTGALFMYFSPTCSRFGIGGGPHSLVPATVGSHSGSVVPHGAHASGSCVGSCVRSGVTSSGVSELIVSGDVL